MHFNEDKIRFKNLEAAADKMGFINLIRLMYKWQDAYQINPHIKRIILSDIEYVKLYGKLKAVGYSYNNPSDKRLIGVENFFLLYDVHAKALLTNYANFWRRYYEGQLIADDIYNFFDK